MSSLVLMTLQIMFSHQLVRHEEASLIRSETLKSTSPVAITLLQCPWMNKNLYELSSKRVKVTKTGTSYTNASNTSYAFQLAFFARESIYLNPI